MKNLKGGTKEGPPEQDYGWCLGMQCFSVVQCLCWGTQSTHGIACLNGRCTVH